MRNYSGHLATSTAATKAFLFSAALLMSQPGHTDNQAFIATATTAELEWGPCPAFMPDGCRLAVLQGDPTDHNADVFFRLPGNSTAPRHWHTSAERMVLVAGRMEVVYDDQKPVVLTPGTYAYGPPRLPHVAHCRSDEDCVLFIAFEEPVDVNEND